jgi:predicted RNA-binding protein with PIN domain
MACILIDGYNLMAKMDGLGGNLEARREKFIRTLSQYREQKYHTITVVFDGEKGGWVTESHERVMGINIVYSRLGEKADDVIKRMVKEEGIEYTVITSDKEVASFAEGAGYIAISSEDFIPKLYSGGRMAKGEWKDEEEEYSPSSVKKKGNPRRLSKAARRRRQRLERL